MGLEARGVFEDYGLEVLVFRRLGASVQGLGLRVEDN